MCAFFDQSALPTLNCAIAKQNKKEKKYSLFQPNGQVSVDINVFNVYFLWALKKKNHVCAVSFHRMWWKIDWYPQLKSIVLINIGNSFRFTRSSHFKWCDCIPEVALFSGCYWSPCFLTQMPKPACLSRACKRAHSDTYSRLTYAHTQCKAGVRLS